MNISYNLRQYILAALILIVICSFTLSYAISIIAVFLFVPYYFFDSLPNIKYKSKVLLQDKIVWAYVLLFIVQMLGVTYSENKDFAFRRIEVMLPLLFLPGILSVEHLSSKILNDVLKLVKFLIPLTFIGLLIFHTLILGKNINTFVNFTITEGLGISQFYLAFILLLPVIECSRQIFSGKSIGLNVIILLINLGVIILLGNKTTMAFLTIFGVLAVFQLFHKNKKNAIILILVLGGLMILASQLSIVQNRLGVISKTTDLNLTTILTKNKYTITKNTAEHRVLIDYISLRAIKSSLPFGYGTGDYLEPLFDGYDQLGFKAGKYYKYNAHNQYLAEFLKTGVLGGLIFIVLMIFLLKNVTRKNPFSYIIAFFAFACLFESYLFRQHGVIIFAFLLPLIVYNTSKLD